MSNFYVANGWYSSLPPRECFSSVGGSPITNAADGEDGSALSSTLLTCPLEFPTPSGKNSATALGLLWEVLHVLAVVVEARIGEGSPGSSRKTYDCSSAPPIGMLGFLSLTGSASVWPLPRPRMRTRRVIAAATALILASLSCSSASG